MNFFSDFMPHGHCYAWTPSILWSSVNSDGIIAISYFSIPITLLYFMRKREDLPFSWIFALIGISDNGRFVANDGKQVTR